MAFKSAVKHDAKLRLALCGPAGSGKTFSLLKLATELGGKIAYIDTEHGSASKYAHTRNCGEKCADPSHFSFDVEEPASFDPRQLMEFIDEAVKAGYDVLCIDSLSHYWMGPNGELEMVDAAAKRDSRGNSFAAWKTVTPIHNKLVDLLLSAPIHILVAMRTKTEWVVEQVNGKNVPRKVGLAPIMRDGIEFEFDVCGDLDQDNNLTITKSRCSKLQGKVINRPGREMAEALREWLGSAGDYVVRDPAPEPAAGIDTGGHPEGTQAAADHVAQEKVKVLQRGKVTFEALAGFKAIKTAIKEYAGSDAQYYEILKAHGYEHSNKIRTQDEARAIYVEMAKFLKRQERADDLIKTLEDVRQAIGEKALMGVLQTFACKSIPEVLLLDGTTLTSLLAETKALTDAVRDQPVGA